MVWLVGCGTMSKDYVPVLRELAGEFQVIGRSESSAKKFTEETGEQVISGGLSQFLASGPEIPPQVAIVSVGIDVLTPVTMELLEYGVKRILLEKPGGLTTEDFVRMNELAREKGAQVYIAYNRRFYSSVLKAEEIIEQDGGVTSFHFDFTEWAHVVANDPTKSKNTMEKWFLGNSSHVADMAFYLGGRPSEMSCFTSGSLAWHSAAAAFSGAGTTEKGALFSYEANWDAPGRWGLWVRTKKHKLVFEPLERLSIQQLASVKIEPAEIDDELDTRFKPGLYLQVKHFLDGVEGRLCTLESQLGTIELYNKMAGYR